MFLLFACADDPTTPDDPASEPAPAALPYDAPGPWSAGTAQADVTTADGLVLPVQVWYPTNDDGPGVVYDGLLDGDAVEDAAPDCAEPRPLVAFSHGFGGIRWQSPFFGEFLASHGYVVISPDHVGNTFLDLNYDLQFVLELGSRRPDDVRQVVDWLFTEAEATGSPWAGCVDPAGGYAISGHSFGGYTALALAGATVNDPLTGDEVDLGDDRVWAAIAMAPWDADGAITDGGKEIAVPTLILTGERDEVTPIDQVKDLWQPMKVQPRYLAVAPDGGHYSFSPVACLLSTGDGCGEDYVDVDTFTALVNQSSAALLGDLRGLTGSLEQLPLDAPELDWTVRTGE